MIFFNWEACWGKTLNLDQLHKSGWSLVNWCVLCKEEIESIDHILLHYDKARMAWFLCAYKVKGLASHSFMYFLDYLEGKKLKSVLKMETSD